MNFKVVVPLSKPFRDSKGSSEHFIDAVSKESALSKVLVRLLQSKPLSYSEPGKGPRQFGSDKIGLLYHIISKNGDFKVTVTSEPVKEEKKEDREDWKMRGVKQMKKKVRDNLQTSLFAMDKVAGLLQGKGFLRFAEQVDQISNTIDIIMAPVINPLEQLITGLNGDISREYSALVQYSQHSTVIEGPGFESFIGQLKEHSQDEARHALLLSDRVSFLGGIPTTEVAPRFTSNDPIELLKMDLRAEEEAIRNYKERITQALQMQDYGTAHLIESILIEEEEHKLDLITILGGNI